MQASTKLYGAHATTWQWLDSTPIMSMYTGLDASLQKLWKRTAGPGRDSPVALLTRARHGALRMPAALPMEALHGRATHWPTAATRL